MSCRSRLAALIVGLFVAGCVSVAPNRLSSSETADLKITSIEVRTPETARIDWTSAEDAYLKSRSLSQTDPAPVRTPEARAYVNDLAAQRLKRALERVLADRPGGARPVRLAVTLKNVDIPSATRRIIAGGYPRVSADIDIADVRTGAILTTYAGDYGMNFAGQGIGGVIIDAALVSGGMDDLYDRAAMSLAESFKAWLASR